MRAIENADRSRRPRCRVTDAIAAVREAVAAIAATETAAVLEREGIEVVRGRAAFISPQEIEVGRQRLRARRFVVATGSRPAIPPIRGLTQVGYLTNETVFGLHGCPASLAVLGGGAVGCELAQAFRRFGTAVTVVEEAPRLLPAMDRRAARVIEHVFRREGIQMRTGVPVIGVEQDRHGVRLSLARGEAERVLVATGREPVTGGLAAEAAGVRLDGQGHIVTGPDLVTSAPGIYAAGDVTGRMPFTHAAHAMGRLAARNATGGRQFARGAAHGLPGRRGIFTTTAIPRVIFTDPEVAQVGITEDEAAGRRGSKVAYLSASEVDRAVTAGATDGFVQLIAGPRPLLGKTGGGRVLGGTIVAARAGEMIHEIALAIRTGMFTGRLAQAVHAYPTWSLAVQQAAAQFFPGATGLGGRRALAAARRQHASSMPGTR